MRKSFVALSLMVGAALLLTNLAVAQDNLGHELLNAQIAKKELSRALKLGTASGSGTDTTWVGHSVNTPNTGYPWFVGRGPNRPYQTAIAGPGVETHDGFDGTWNWDKFNPTETDSLQGWFPIRRRYASTGGLTLDDTQRPWWCLDYGNQANYVINALQKRTFGIVGVWHVDGGSTVLQAGEPATANPAWTPITGTGSAWCGLRASDDETTADAIAIGGTGNAYNQNVLMFNREASTSTSGTDKKFPGYASAWDQILYHDVRVNDLAGGDLLRVSFKYRTRMSNGRDLTTSSRTGWFDKDPSDLNAGNLISSSAAGAPAGGGGAPVDSFMVYVGVPTNPADYQRADGSTANVVYDLKRRWFSEVIALDAPYKEILTTSGDNAVTTATVDLPATVINPMLTNFRNGGAGGVIRVAFRSKTNRGFDDEDNFATGYTSGTEGAVRIDDVFIGNQSGTPVQVPATTTFEAGSGDISNVIEPPNAGNGGSFVLLGQGYALGKWHSTGKPPAIFFHTHPITGGDIDGGVGVNNYNALEYHDLCGAYNSAARQCNLDGVVISAGDHDRGEAAGGPPGTAFVEQNDGMASPVINFATPGVNHGVNINVSDPGQNNVGLDGDDVTTTRDYGVWYEMYAGVFNLVFSGNSWQIGAMSFPAVGPSGVASWGNMRFQPSLTFNPDPQCFQAIRRLKNDASILSSNANGIPDSLRVLISKQQQCFRFAVTLGCSPTTGAYWDNVSLAFIDLVGTIPGQVASASAIGTVFMNFWDTYQDCFPRNQTVAPSVAAAFDTCGSLAQTGLNIEQSNVLLPRPIVSGDTIIITSAGGVAARLDMVFRIKPGPGNYVTLGSVASGLRAVPSSPAAAGASSFWGQYAADNGVFGSGAAQDGVTPGPGHVGAVGGWSADLWNSARADTAEFNIFPVAAKGNLPLLVSGTYMNTYLEDASATSKYQVLGIIKNRCFMIDTAGAVAVNPSNITCSSVPAWATTVPASRTGYRGGPGGPGPEVGLSASNQTKEYTKIIPDGLLTAGSHVEYFFRKSEGAAPGLFVMGPDSNLVAFQSAYGSNFDGERYGEYSVLPDRWKDTNYGGDGAPCMLFVDWNDRRGDELTWVGVADSIGATKVAKFGAHNGWHAAGNYDINALGLGPIGNYTFNPAQPDNGSVWKHGGQPGTTWDMYGVRASESTTTASGSLGQRLGPAAANLEVGKDAKQGPTPLMLRTFYRMMMISSGDLTSGILGPYPNRSADDVAMIIDFMQTAAGTPLPRGVLTNGDGFVESATQLGQTTLLSTFLAVSLRDPGYQTLAANLNTSTDLIPTTLISPTGDVFGLDNNCTFSNDVLKPNVPAGGVAASFYQNTGTVGPYVAGVYAPPSGPHPAVTLVDGFDLVHLGSRFNENSFGRLVYFTDVFTNVFGSLCAVNGTPNVDVPQNTGGSKFVNFMNLRNNPFSSGQAAVHFGLAKSDRVEVKVYDVTGRLVRSLANRNFPAGEHTLTWDGTDDSGNSVSRGVYFTQVKFVNSKFVDAKKLTVLK
jgi:FlgD Ig-like domain